jgi:conjugal transfer pilus assembly protein TraA
MIRFLQSTHRDTRATNRLPNQSSEPGQSSNTTTSRPVPTALLTALAIIALAGPGLSLAGTGGTEFTVAYTTITGWLQGDLGRLLAASLLIVGLVMGVVRQSIMAAVPAIAAGLVATVGPTIIGAVVTAVI